MKANRGSRPGPCEALASLVGDHAVKKNEKKRFLHHLGGVKGSSGPIRENRGPV